MKKLVSNIRYYFERNGFYVSSRLADRLGMRVKSVRLFFTLAFWLKLKDLIYTKRTSVFDL